MFKRNVGTADRLLRAAVGLVLISLVFVGPETAWGWVGVMPLLTAIAGYCPAYGPFGLNTCRAGRADT